MSSPFEFDATQSHHLSDDGVSDDSNFEHLSSESTGNASDQELFYWLGKHVLAFRLAQNVARHSIASATQDDLEVS